jgi:uncharacterized membrane protein HdeD (DUF308 family)
MMKSMTATPLERDQRPSGKLILLGSLMIVLGVLFMVVPKAVGRASGMYLGVLLVVTGLVEAFSGRRGDPEQHRGLLTGGGTLALVVGVLMLARPSAAFGVVSLLFIVFLLGAGLEALWVSLAGRYRGWQWDCLFGAAAVIFGIAIAFESPGVALWLPGSLVGIAIVVRGATMLAGGLGHDVRRRSIQHA